MIERRTLTLEDLGALPPTLTAQQVAELLNIGRNQVYELARRGEVPSLKLGRTVRFPTARLLAMLGIEGDPVGPGEVGGARGRADDG